MTIETMQAKVADLERQKQQAVANVNAIDGAIQMLYQLIQEESNPIEPEVEPAIRS